MQHRFPLPAIAVVALLGAGGIVAAQDRASAQAQGGGKPAHELKIGVVDLSQVFKLYRKSADLEQKLNGERDKLKKEIEEISAQIRNINKELELLAPDSETYRIKEEEKDILIARWERKKRRLEESVKKLLEQYNLAILDDIEAVVKQYGQDQGFSMILKLEGKPSDDANFPEEYKLLARYKAVVLYSSRELDITGPIVDQLNKNYDAKQIAPAPGGAGAPKGPTPPPAPPKGPEKK